MSGLSGKRILVTGATGFIGRHLCARLSRHHSVRALVRDPSKAVGLFPEGIEIACGDVRDPGSVGRAMRGMEGVFHLASVLPRGDVVGRPMRAVNVEGTRHVMTAAVEAKVERLVHVSSISVYGFQDGRISEVSPWPSPCDSYGMTKREAEGLVRELVRDAGLPAVIVQPSEVYGPYDEGWTLTPMRMIREGKAILPGGGRGRLQPIYIDDLLEGLLAAYESGRPGESYILSGPESVTVRAYFESIGSLVGKPKLRSVPAWLAMGMAGLAEGWGQLTGKPGRLTRNALRYVMRRAEYSHEKARSELGFNPRIHLDEGIDRLRQWLESEPDSRSTIG